MRKRTLFGLMIGASMLLPPLAWPGDGEAFYNIEVGKDRLENVTLPTLDGKEAELLRLGEGANVFIFFRPGAEPSHRGLKDMAGCAEELADYPVYWTALVSDRYPAAEVEAVVNASGFSGPVLIDKDNVLYGQYGVRLHPTVGITDGRGLLTAYQPYSQINYCAQVKARVLHTLGEIDAAELDRRLHPGAVNPKSNGAAAVRNLRMGERFLQMGKPDQALATARRSLELAPELGAAHGLAALALARQGDCAAARGHIEQALVADGDEKNALAAKAECDR